MSRDGRKAQGNRLTTWHFETRCYFVGMEGTPLTPEERERKRRRRANRDQKRLGLSPKYPTLKETKAREKRKAKQRRKRNGSEQRRRVSKHDGRRGWVKAYKAAGDWTPVEEYCEDRGWTIKHWRRKKPVQPPEPILDEQDAEIDSPPPSSPTPKVYPGGPSFKPRVEQGTVRQSFSAGRSKAVAIERRTSLMEPLPQPLHIIPADKP
jgi:hypothetical protein